MKGIPGNLDWTFLQSFAAVVREGSLSGAARALGLSQPTVGRHIKALEQALGVELFLRAPRGLVPTDAGLEMLEHARAMESAAARIHLAAEGRSGAVSGTVRITASVVVSHFVLPPVIARIRQALPEIQIELVPSDTTENLLFREADIAVRMYRPTQLDVITRHVADQQLALYAASAYLDRAGRPADAAMLMELDFVGFDRSDTIIRAMRDFGIHVRREFFPVRCDDQAAYWQLVCAGCGVGAAQVAVGDAEPRVERVLPFIELPPLPVWLAAPEALKTSPRIRRVWDMLAEALGGAGAA